jgi:hypothetical protein
MTKRERDPPNKSGETPRIRPNLLSLQVAERTRRRCDGQAEIPSRRDRQKLEFVIKVIVYNTTVLIKSTQRGVKRRSRKFCGVHNFQTNPWPRNTT